MEAAGRNPFAVQTPEHLSATDVVSLFVSDMTDYWQILNQGHTIIYGPRGAGKSMIFRYMEADCQIKAGGKRFSELPYYAAYIPIKETELNLSEFSRMEQSKYAPSVLNEHLMIANVAAKLFTSLLNRIPLEDFAKADASELRTFYRSYFAIALERAGWAGEIRAINGNTPARTVIQRIAETFDAIYAEGNSYLRHMAFRAEPTPYSGALFGYADFLVPIVKKLCGFGFMPDAPIYLLIDDADNLNSTQTMVLNSWVASRTTGYLCLKVSTQTMGYKTHKTPNGKRIDSPHDFSEVHICDIYTTKKDTYRERVHRIVERRLQIYGIGALPEQFFPDDATQEAEILEKARQIKENFAAAGRGAKPSDDALRYARPDFIKELSGRRKSGSSYSYAGFSQLVHISSGVIRHFLDAASLMFGEAQSRRADEVVDHIPPAIQDKSVRALADQLLFSNFAHIERDEAQTERDRDNVRKLRNLIHALGGMFYQILISDAAERRVFSIAFSDGPDDEVQAVLNLGLSYGYFHRSSIGNKEGTGRVPLYIMSRRLAPAFKLDPTSFAGYKFVRNVAILEAMARPKALLSQVKIKGFEAVMEVGDQGNLFE